jgi:DNA-binding response OmpR family regulator
MTSRAQLRVLVVDDEEPLARLVAGYLKKEGFVVETVGDGLDAVEAARARPPAVIVLDLMLPGIDGVEVCRRIRTFSDAYIVMLTARSEELDTLVGLSVGADDYVTKPFSPRELVARIHAMLRRPRTPAGGAAASQIRVGTLAIDSDAHELRLDGALVDVTPLELALLVALAEQPNVAFTRRQLLDRVWSKTWVGDEHVVDVHVANLRRKLGDDPRAPRFIRTVRGVGYRIGPG